MSFYERRRSPWGGSLRRSGYWIPQSRPVGDIRPTDFGGAARVYREHVRAARKGLTNRHAETPPTENPDGSVTFSEGTRVVLRLGYKKVGQEAPDDWAYKTVGTIVLFDQTTVRQSDPATMDLEAGTVTRSYRLEPHPGDGNRSKAGFLDTVRFLNPELFEGLPQAPVRAIRLERTVPGYKRVR